MTEIINFSTFGKKRVIEVWAENIHTGKMTKRVDNILWRIFEIEIEKLKLKAQVAQDPKEHNFRTFSEQFTKN